MGILGAKNKVIAGDYIGGKIMHSGGKVVLSINLGNMIILNKKMVAAHKIESEVKGNHKISVTFAVTPNLIRSGSEHTNAFWNERAFTSFVISAIAPAP